MPSIVPFQHRPDTWIKVWIGLGLFTFFLMIVIPMSIVSLYNSELNRAQACAQGQRTDCQPSAFWMLYGWTGKPENTQPAPAEMPSAVPTEQPAPSAAPQTNATQTSSTAPTIVQVSLAGATYDQGSYRATVGTVLTVTAVIADAKSAVLYQVPETTDTPAKKIATMTKQPGGNYVATFKVSPGLNARLEVRATAANGESASVFLNVAAK